MSDSHYPLVDAKFFIEKLLESEKIDSDSHIVVGNTHTFNLKGNKPLHKKLILVREIDGEINFMQATGLASLYGFMRQLLDWYEANKDWKEGAYVVSKHKKN